jgi:uncharacterized protein YjbI with pentapeptide repeats
MSLTEYSPPRTKFQKLDYLLDGKQLRFRRFPIGGSESTETLEARTIEAAIIEKMVKKFNGSVNVSIRIENAIIKGSLNLAYVTFKGELSIINSVFTEPVDFSFATFESSVFFDRSKFLKRADFRSSHAMHDFRLCYARFLSDCSFMDFRCHGVFRAEGAHFSDVTFHQAQFDKRVLFCPKNPEDKDAQAERVCFNGNAIFTDARIKGFAHFEGAYFGKNTYFNRIGVDSSASFSCYVENSAPGIQPVHELVFLHTCFRGKVYFSGARIEGTISFKGAHFHQKADFERIWTGGHALFQPFEREDKQPTVSVRFMKEARFLAAHIGGNAEFDGAHFEQRVTFEGIKVGHKAFFRSFEDANKRLIVMEFGGLAKFLGAHISGDAEFSGAQFTSTRPGDRAWFESINIEGNAYFDNNYRGIYVGPVLFKPNTTFTKAHFHSQAVFNDAHFEAVTKFTNVDVGGGTEFKGAEFEKETYFTSAHFHNQADFRKTRFKQEADFTDVEIDGSALFNDAHFEAVMKFTNLDAKGGTEFKGAEFEKETYFTSAHFHNQADFRKTRFIQQADFTDVEIDGAAFFSEADFQGKTIFKAARFKSLDLMAAKFVSRKLILRGLDADDPVAYNFKRRWIFVKKVSEGNMDMGGFTCEHIDVNWSNLSRGLHVFDRQPYTVIEKAFRSSGKNLEADSVYFDLCCHEGQELRDKVYRRGKYKGLSGREKILETGRSLREAPRAFLNLIEGVGFHHGIRPYRLLVFSLAVVALGTYIFSQEGAIKLEKGEQIAQQIQGNQLRLTDTVQSQPVNQNSNNRPAISDAINVSLHQFIPLVDIPPGKEWAPSNEPVPFLKKLSFKGRVLSFAGYAAIHRVFGFILIPLGVAALTGILHRRGKDQ